MKCNSLHMVAFCLLVVGGLNVGLAALGFNVVNMVLGGMPFVEKVVYLLVGASAVYLAVCHSKDCKACK